MTRSHDSSGARRSGAPYLKRITNHGARRSDAPDPKGKTNHGARRSDAPYLKRITNHGARRSDAPYLKRITNHGARRSDTPDPKGKTNHGARRSDAPYLKRITNHGARRSGAPDPKGKTNHGARRSDAPYLKRKTYHGARRSDTPYLKRGSAARICACATWLALVICGAAVLDAICAAAEPVSAQVLNTRPVHLRSGEAPEWDEFKQRTPDSASLTIPFVSHANPEEATLLITQDDVKQDWRLQLNGRRIGALFLMEAPLVHTLAVPPGLLREGENTLTIDPPNTNDDIRLGRIVLDFRPPSVVLSQSYLDLQVTEESSGAELPARMTIVDEDGSLAALRPVVQPGWAVRPGVAYCADGRIRLGVVPGRYHLFANRGFEYGLAREQVMVEAGQTVSVHLQLRREVATPGWVASDTHVHTGTYARHGDATVDERVVTLAGEGIELPISTEHDCLVDLTGAAYRNGVQDRFTSVVGDEVTTPMGHFNVFPVAIQAPLPDRTLTNWPKLMEMFRATPGVQVVVLNHPRNIHNSFQPFAATNFNAVTGENLRGFEFAFDAMEVANSSALQSDWMASFRDWFALLNYGYRVTAVGSSDGHDVSRYIVGQGRTYIRCDDTHPGRLNVGEACRQLKQGHALVSLGLLAYMTVNDRFTVGDLATNLPDSLHVQVTVQGPSWVSADRVELFANGIRIREHLLPPRDPASSADRLPSPFRLEVAWDIPRPKHDVHLIALASGPGILEPYWAIARPYQPSSPRWDPRLTGCTNPIWIDADGDGKFTPARGYARRLRDAYPADPAGLAMALQAFDAAVAAQVASLASGARR